MRVFETKKTGERDDNDSHGDKDTRGGCEELSQRVCISGRLYMMEERNEATDCHARDARRSRKSYGKGH